MDITCNHDSKYFDFCIIIIKQKIFIIFTSELNLKKQNKNSASYKMPAQIR